MIGGTVIETIVLPDKVWINCEDKRGHSQCAIYVTSTPKSRSVSEGDKLWWQGPHALWTPAATIREVHRSGHWGKANRDYDIKLERIGCSGVQRPS